MKKTRNLISIILAVLVAFASMPMVSVATSAEIMMLAEDESGTVENPTISIEATGSSTADQYKNMNFKNESNTFSFYQTKSGEVFAIRQTLFLQAVYNIVSRKVTIETIPFATSDGVAGGREIMESNIVGTDVSSDFVSNRFISQSWLAGNNHAEESGVTQPENYELRNGTLDITGNIPYLWESTVKFTGLSDSEKGELNTGFDKVLLWHYTEDSVVYNAALKYGTKINIIDAREFKNQLDNAEYIISNPSNYTREYVSSVEATYNSIPDDVKDFSKLYTQEEIDAFTKLLEDVSLNSADYTVYNQYYSELKRLDNHTGSWTEKSFALFKAEIAEIDGNLPKNLDKTYQSTVDAAVEALVEAYEKLEAADLSSNDTSVNYTTTDPDHDGDMNFNISDTEFKFMQTKDDQVFNLEQIWNIVKTSGSIDREFRGLILDISDLSATHDNCINGFTLANNQTSEFLNYLSSDSYGYFTAENEHGDSVANYESTCWNEIDENGNPKETTTVDASGRFDENRNFVFKTDNNYYWKITPKIVGLGAGETTEYSISLNFVQRMGYYFKTSWFGGGRYKHFHVNSTVQITADRQLIAAVDDANAIIANPGTHSENYISALKAAVSAVPQYMLYGSEFYTQAEVNKLTNAILNVQENCADYTEFNNVFGMLSNVENEGRYTEESYNDYIDEIYSINANLDKNLTVEDQSVIDNAVKALFEAQNKLVSLHLNSDEEFTSSDISDSLGNNTLKFTISSTEYKFMQISDGQKFTVNTSVSVENTRTNYIGRSISLKISQLDGNSGSANYYNNLCPNRGDDTDTGCHGGDTVLVNDYATLLSNVTGLNVFSEANAAGDIAEFNTWKNTAGVALSQDGLFIDGAELKDDNRYGSAEASMIYSGVSGNAETPAPVELSYALRFGWSYQEGAWGSNTKRHVHIPVTIQITDARALNALYKESMNAVLGKTNEKYTLATLENLYKALIATPSDMAYGESYYTQEQVNEKYNALKAAYDSLKEGADYSEYFKEQVKAEDIIATGNKDAAGNNLYSDEAYEEYTKTVTDVINSLDKNLDATEDNQKIIDSATQALKDAQTKLDESKYADYEEFEEALNAANEILSAPEGTYTDETIEAVQNAVNSANEVPKNLPVSEQSTVDAATDALQSVVKDALYRADYSEYEETKAFADSITNSDGIYTDSAYQEYLEKIAQIDASLDKNLPDYAVNREIIANATKALNDAIAELNNNKKADYSEFEAKLEELNNITNTDASGNEIYDPAAFEEFKNTVNAIDNGLNRDLTEHNQSTIDDATQALINAQNKLEENKWADYTELNESIAAAEEILSQPEGTYTQQTIDAVKAALEAAKAIESGMVVGAGNANQNAIDEAAQALKNANAAIEKKADYSAFEDALNAAQAIKNDTSKTYTNSSLEAIEEALNKANALDKDLSEDEQAIVDEVTSALTNAVNSAQEKADYSEFNDVKAELEAIVNTPEGTYTEETVDKATDVLNRAEALDNDLPKTEENQKTIDDLTNEMKEIIANAEKKADYTEYDNVKNEIQDIIDAGNVDSNGEKIYDDEVFEELKNTLTETDTNLDKDLPEDEQTTVDRATETLENIKEKLENSKIYTITFVDADNITLAQIDYTNGTLLKNIDGKPALPENTDVFKYIGWVTTEGVLYTDETAVNGDVTVSYAGEYVKIAPVTGSTLNFGKYEGYTTGVNKNTTVSALKAQLENDLTYIEIKDYTGADLADEALVGSGSTITLKSKYTGIVYETKTVIIYGDLDGDGDVDNDDYAKAKRANVGLGRPEHTIDGVFREYFYIANDVNGDGYIDVLDTSVIVNIKNNRYTVI